MIEKPGGIRYIVKTKRFIILREIDMNKGSFKPAVAAVFLAVLAVGAALWFILRDQGDTGYRRPGCNVILISLDTLRADRLGCYGYEKNTSPAIDRFAEKALLFENSFSNASWTLPSHMSLMTSMYPKQHGVRDQDSRLSRDKKTLAEALRDEGYRTAAFTAGYLVSAVFGFDRGFEVYMEEYNTKKENPDHGWRLKHVAKNLMFWLEENKDEKFFLFVHCYDTHEPFIAHTYMEKFEEDYDGRLDFLNNRAAFNASPEYKKYKEYVEGYFNINIFYREIINKGRIEMREPDIGHIRALYDNEVRYVDYYFGKLMDELTSMGLMDNTVIIVWSDHGQELLERGRIQHGGSLHDEIIGVPLIVYIPGMDGGRTAALAQGIDIAPTILDILGIQSPPGFMGVPLLSTKRGNNPFVAAQQKRVNALRTGEYKLLVHNKTKDVWLFDLGKDPGEMNNIAAGHPELVNDLKAALFNELDLVDLDEDMIRKLKSLGYLDK